MRYRSPRKKFNYSELINDSFRITWRNKFLWFFGLFSASSISSMNSPNFSNSFDSSSFEGNGNGASDYTDFTDWVVRNKWLVIGIAAAAILLFILFWLWSIVCRGAVINSVRDVREGRSISFGTAWRGGLRSFTRLLLYDLFMFLIMIGLAIISFAVILLIVFMIASGQVGAFILSVIGLMLVPLFMVSFGYLACCSCIIFGGNPIGIWLNLAQRAVVLEDLRPVESLRRSWRVIMDNLTHSLLLMLLSIGLGIAAGLAALLLIGIAAIPAIVAWIITGVSGWSLAGIIISSLLSLMALVAALVVFAAINTYFTTYWTIAYRKLSGQEGYINVIPETQPLPPAPAMPQT